ncbi:MAG: TfoX/Sxy family protein [Thermoleophilia bacterium]|nr:TfoX/Sxy family protein [Thermoleophilia bacterium]
MASDAGTAQFILDQLCPLDVRVRRMFGEFALYCDERVVGFVCDDELFVKRTDGPGDMAADLPLGRPYPGAKEYLRVPGDRLENRDWLQDLVRATAAAVPPSAPGRARGGRSRGA